MNILVFAGLSDDKLVSKISPMIELNKVDNVYLVRNSRLSYKKVRSFYPPRFLNVPFIREGIKLLMGLYICLFQKVDFVVGIFLRPHAIFAYITGRIFRKPVIQLFIGNDVNFLENHKRFFGGLLKRPHKIGVRGHRSRDRLNGIVKDQDRFFLHHNVFLLSEKHGKIPGEKDIDLLCIADFSKVKRIDIFLKVVAVMKEKRPDVRALMIGQGWHRKKYEAMKHRLDLDQNVIFAGYVKDVYFYLKRSRVFILTSEAEGLPMSMVEAMTAGVPCVAPEVGDIGEIAIDGYNACIVKPGDVDAFSACVLRLLEDEKLAEKLSFNAQATLREREETYSLEYNSRIWEKILV